jgi:RNA polymerase sigma-70 factor (ECF subfamily)
LRHFGRLFAYSFVIQVFLLQLGFGDKAMSRKKSDSILIEEFKRGSQSSFEELINRYAGKAFSLALRLTRSQEDAEEVLQDVFVTVARKIRDFEGKSTFSSWLYRVTVNAALMKLRKRKQDRSVLIEDVQPQVQEAIIMKSVERVSTEQEVARTEVAHALEEAIQRLPDEYRPVFVMRDVDGLTSGEVSRILNITIPAVKSRLHRSRMMLRRRLARFHGEFCPDIAGRVANS